MATTIERAIKRQRKSMTLLYEANKQKVYYVSLLLLGSEEEAAKATSFAFTNVWGDMTAHGVETEAEFRHLAISRAVDYCKKKVTRENPKAFRVPNEHKFSIVGEGTLSDEENASEDFVSLLPPLQRFIFVLNHVGEYLPEQTAGTFKLSVKAIRLALEAEPSNLKRILHCTEEQDQKYEDALLEVCDSEKDVLIPSSIDEKIAAVIDELATPVEKKRRKKCSIIGAIALAACLLVVGIVAVATHSGSTSSEDLEEDTTLSDTETEEISDTSVISEPVIDLDDSLTYYADIEIEGYGTVTVELDQESAPITVANFVNLAQNGFYDGLTFHRIIEGFMMQGGDPNGDGTGGSDECIVGEFTDNGYENALSHTRGAISMARSTDYDSASSQFFIVHEDSTSLDGQYAVFGYVTEGMEIVDAVCEAAEPTDDNGTIEADAQPVITSITIRTAEK